MTSELKPPSSENKNVSINGDVSGVVVVGDNNNVVNNQTTIRKIINYIFPSEKETLEHRNRRILLGHVENAWIKGVLDASLHGTALLDLEIKQDLEAVTKYPWAIKKEETDETLPAGTSMLEIFDSIGMGRSLLILGAPGSGKTTMLLELARGFIARAREDDVQPIPMVFNLASWTEKLTLTDWLVQELNNQYSVPRKIAPDWVKGNKLLLLLDGLDEVRQESRAMCVEAINEFRKQNGMTSLTVCSRSQDYADLSTKLSFEGAIEVQPLTQKQIAEFFNLFGDEMAGIQQVLKKDSILREMAETPLFLSIMISAYQDRQDLEIMIPGNEETKRKNLFKTYVERMFNRPRSKNGIFKKQDVSNWLSSLAAKMIEHNQVPYFLESMQPEWLEQPITVWWYRSACILIGGLVGGLTAGLSLGLSFGLIYGLIFGLVMGISFTVFFGLGDSQKKISTVDSLSFSWKRSGIGLSLGMGMGVIIGLIVGLMLGLNDGLIIGLIFTLIFGLGLGLGFGLVVNQVDNTTIPGQRLVFSAKNFLFSYLLWVVIGGLFGGLIGVLSIWLSDGNIGGLNIEALDFYLIFCLIGGLNSGLFGGFQYGGLPLIQHYTLRLILASQNILPWRLVPFLDHSVDLIFLRRVGGGYIFIHRLLMEHFAEMYADTPK